MLIIPWHHVGYDIPRLSLCTSPKFGPNAAEKIKNKNATNQQAHKQTNKHKMIKAITKTHANMVAIWKKSCADRW